MPVNNESEFWDFQAAIGMLEGQYLDTRYSMTQPLNGFGNGSYETHPCPLCRPTAYWQVRRNRPHADT